ncbi:hypothetical protein ILYODFUR_025555 [Ilyodon furcidens]|uniref:Uncharacterized protein n=1 Tax=Ilyodon furcidens TaxID=33524 RepID=A0ABV0T047_9TELE
MKTNSFNSNAPTGRSESLKGAFFWWLASSHTRFMEIVFEHEAPGCVLSHHFLNHPLQKARAARCDFCKCKQCIRSEKQSVLHDAQTRLDGFDCFGLSATSVS